MGPNSEMIENTSPYSQGKEEVIKVKNSIMDLGIIVDTILRYKDHIQKDISKANKNSGWVLRTFLTREVNFMKKMWNTLI